MNVKAHMDTETVSEGCDGVFLKNTVVTLNPKLGVPQSASGKDKSDEKGNSGDSDINVWGLLDYRATEPKPKLVATPSASAKSESGEKGDSGGHDVDMLDVWSKLYSHPDDRKDFDRKDDNRKDFGDEKWTDRGISLHEQCKHAWSKRRKQLEDVDAEQQTEWSDHQNDRAPAAASESWGSASSSAWPSRSSQAQPPPWRRNDSVTAAARESRGSASSYAWLPRSAQPQPLHLQWTPPKWPFCDDVKLEPDEYN
jgi:hypothetical protein